MKPEHSGILIPGVANSHTRSVDCPLAFSVSAGSNLRRLPDSLAGVFPVPEGGVLLLGQFSELVVDIPRTHRGSLGVLPGSMRTQRYSPAKGSQVHFRAWRH